MNTSIIYPQGRTTDVAVAASDKLYVKSNGPVKIYEKVSDPNMPDVFRLLVSVPKSSAVDGYVTSAFSAATTVQIEAGEAEVQYSIGTAPLVLVEGNARVQGDVNTLNATGTLTAAMILGGIVTSTATAAVTATLVSGALLDAASSFDTSDAFNWSVINTNTANAFTVTAGSTHTVVGDGAVTGASGLFATRKTAADTFVTYRLA